jgi:hypothetical protein
MHERKPHRRLAKGPLRARDGVTLHPDVQFIIDRANEVQMPAYTLCKVAGVDEYVLFKLLKGQVYFPRHVTVESLLGALGYEYRIVPMEKPSALVRKYKHLLGCQADPGCGAEE